MITLCLKEVPLRHLFFSGFLLCGQAYAAPTIDELAPLDFGTLAITGNATVSTLEFPASGRNLIITGNLILVEEGAAGRYRLTGFPANTGIDVTVDEAPMTAGGTGIPEPLTVHDYEVARVRTNDLGEAEFALGASFSTSGNGGKYEDARYAGDARMRLYYWEPAAGQYVTVTQRIDFKGEVRSSFALEEVTAMNFGTLFARAEPDHQASLRLLPDGRLDIQNAGDAKILSLSSPSPAVLSVSGAAPNRQLTITPEAGEVQMRHRDKPTGPHFILTALETSPEGAGRTDDTGQLEIRVGATLKTQKTSTVEVYPSGTYEASYSVTVSY